MNRRNFLHASAAFASLGLLSRDRLLAQISQLPQAAPLPDGFVALRRNTGIFNGRGGTIGWLASADALAIIDTQFPDTAARCRDGLSARNTRQIDLVINTHHHGDHTSGNPVFRPLAKTIVAHKNVPALQRAAAARANPPTLDKQVYADTTFEKTWKTVLSDETLHIRHLGPAHTGGDGIVYFEKANVVHTGDLVFNRIYPVIDRIGGASIANWMVALEVARQIFPSDALYVFGHGNPKFGVTGKRDDLLVMQNYLSGLMDYTRKQIAAGKPRAEIVTLENLPGFPDYHTPRPNRLQANLGVAYDELTNASLAT